MAKLKIEVTDEEVKNANIDIEFKKERDYEEYIIKFYNPTIINECPKSENDLLKMYRYHTDYLYQYAILTTHTYLHPNSNEIRAFLGHLSKYRTEVKSAPGKTELRKAYGHFKRLNLDIMKIICDEFDQSIALKINSNIKYDFNNVYKNYIQEIGDMYIKAKKEYINAQKIESVGTDTYDDNIIFHYYKAIISYINAKRFYESNRKGLYKRKLLSNFLSFVNWFLLISGIVFGLIPFIKI